MNSEKQSLLFLYLILLWNILKSCTKFYTNIVYCMPTWIHIPKITCKLRWRRTHFCTFSKFFLLFHWCLNLLRLQTTLWTHMKSMMKKSEHIFKSYWYILLFPYECPGNKVNIENTFAKPISSHGVFSWKFLELKYQTNTKNQKEIKRAKIETSITIPKWGIFLFKIVFNCHLNCIATFFTWKCLYTCYIFCQTINTVFPFVIAPVSYTNLQIYW